MVTVCIIFGVDKAEGFSMSFECGKSFDIVCRNIWENPDAYYTPDHWEEFLKYLWVKLPDGKEKRLADIINLTKGDYHDQTINKA